MTRFDHSPGAPDVAEILASIGEAAYEWRLDTDTLVWSGNAASVLGTDPGEIATGRAFASRVDAESGKSRLDAISLSAQGDAVAGGPYQAQYAFKRADTGAKTLLEDNGRWFAGAPTASRRAPMASCAQSTPGTRASIA